MQTSPKDPLATTRLSARIDLLRGLFAIWVFFAHAYGLFVALENSAPGSWLGRWVEKFLTSGHFGVTGFFFLSGFCIHWSISKGLERSHKFSAKDYLKARFWRIAPLFYTALLLTVLLEWLISVFLQRVPMWEMPPDAGRVLAGSLVFLQGLTNGYGGYQPAWSITNEVIYYLAWPVCLMLAGFRVFRAAGLAVIAGLCLTGVFYFLWRKAGGDTGNHFLIGLWTIPFASFMWTTGAASRAGHRRITGSGIFEKFSRWWLPIFALWVVWATTLNALGVSFLVRVVLDPLVWVAVPLLVLADWKVPVGERPLRWLADLSYPLYLLHGPLLIFLASLLMTIFPTGSPAVLTLVSSGVTLLIAGTLGVTVERCFLGLKKKQSARA